MDEPNPGSRLGQSCVSNTGRDTPDDPLPPHGHCQGAASRRHKVRSRRAVGQDTVAPSSASKGFSEGRRGVQIWHGSPLTRRAPEPSSSASLGIWALGEGRHPDGASSPRVKVFMGARRGGVRAAHPLPPCVSSSGGGAGRRALRHAVRATAGRRAYGPNGGVVVSVVQIYA